MPKSTTARGWWVRAAGVALLALAVIAGYLAAQKRQAIDSLAVLPFENANGDRDAEYLSDGITETLIDNLSQLPRLKVMSRNSVFRYKGRLPDAREAGRELGVRAVLTGRIVQRGDDLSISAELVDARDNSHLWGQHFTRRLADVLAVQEEISTQISQSLRLRLSGDEKRLLTRRPTENTEAYQLYLKGRYYWRQFTAAGTQKAIGYFEQAIQKDPNYALAYAGLADSYAFGSAGGGGIAPAEGMPKARTAATSALEIDDALPEAHLSLALVKAFYDWDWSGADKEFRRCLELNPNYAEAHHMYSHYFVALGRIKESFSESQRALELEPLSYDLNWHLGWHYYYARQYDQAIEQLNKAIELSPNSPQAILVMAFAYEQKGDFARATAEVDQIRALSPNSPFGLSDLAHIYAVSGRRSEAVRILEQLDRMEKQRYIPASYRAVVYAGLGDKTQALDWLERVCQEHGFYVATLKVDPRLDPLRSQPRFQALLRRVGLPP